MNDYPNVPDRFEILEVLADTPLARILRANDSVLQREVMIKLPATRASATWSAKEKDRLLREARAVAKIHHENIAPIHWVEETSDGPMLVLDLPEGETLAERLEHGTLEPGEVIAIGTAVAEALAQAHYNGVVHRGVGPSSIRLLPNGKVQLGAFTFAKGFGVHDQASSLYHGERETAADATELPDYSAPEQLAGHAAEPRSDIFALGCTLFRCLAGHDPFVPGRESEPVPDLRKLRKDVGKPLAEVIRKCVMYGKTARFTDANQLAEALKAAGERAAAGGPRRGPVIALTAAAAVVVVTAAVLGPQLLDGGGSATRGDGDPPTATEDVRYQHTYGPDYSKVHGLFIGIGDAYRDTDWPPLKNPVTEARKISAQLRKNDPMWRRDGAITLLEEDEATYAAIERELERLVRDAEKEDAVLIYFAGHGKRDGRSFGLCTADVDGDIRNGTGYLRRDVLVTYLDRLKAKHALVVLDCCHSGAVFEGAEPTRGRDPNLTAAPAPGAHHRRNFSREFLCSAAADELAADGTRMSPFATLLLAQLSQPATSERRYLATRYLSSYIAEGMDQRVSHTSRMQVPKFRQLSEQEGSFVFRLGDGK